MPVDSDALMSLANWRHTREFSQAALACRAAVAQATVARIERGATRPRPGIARRLAAALGTKPDSVVELASAIPQLGRERCQRAEWAHRAAGDDGVRRLVDEDNLPLRSVPQERAEEGIERAVMSGDASEVT